eukprot:Nk52_evm4s302 gene=Nk52_evmTU4s302
MGVLDFFKSVYNACIVYPTVKWVRLGLILQTLACVCLAIVSSVENADFGSVDSPWYYLLQFVVTGLVVYALKWSMPNAKRVKLMLFYAGITMIFGIISGFYFMMFANDLEIKKRQCSDDATLTEAQCDEDKDELQSHINRTAVYVAVQLIALHPIVSYVIELWALEKNN